jgi:hypothetical protein
MVQSEVSLDLGVVCSSRPGSIDGKGPLMTGRCRRCSRGTGARAGQPTGIRKYKTGIKRAGNGMSYTPQQLRHAKIALPNPYQLNHG